MKAKVVIVLLAVLLLLAACGCAINDITMRSYEGSISVYSHNGYAFQGGVITQQDDGSYVVELTFRKGDGK